MQSHQLKFLAATHTLMVMPFKLLTLFKMQLRNFLLGYYVIFFIDKKLRCGRRKSQKGKELRNQTKAIKLPIHISRKHNIPKPSRSPNNSNFLAPCRYQSTQSNKWSHFHWLLSVPIFFSNRYILTMHYSNPAISNFT